MDQVRARRIAKWTGSVATTDAQWRGEFVTADSAWGVAIGPLFFTDEKGLPEWVQRVVKEQEEGK